MRCRESDTYTFASAGTHSPGTTSPGQTSHQLNAEFMHITLPVVDSNNKPDLISSRAFEDRSNHHLHSFTRGIRSSPLWLGPAGFAWRRFAPPRAPINLTCSCIPLLLSIGMSLRDAIISLPHFISSRGVDEEIVRALHGYLDMEVPCVESLNVLLVFIWWRPQLS
jgi:hypothetical protein